MAMPLSFDHSNLPSKRHTPDALKLDEKANRSPAWVR